MSKDQLLRRYEQLGHGIREQPLDQVIRVNTLKIPEKELVSRLEDKGVQLEKIVFLQHGYRVNSPFPLVSSEEYLLGYFYIQEAASQLPAQVLLEDVDIKFLPEDTKILDACAAPGSKTTQLAQLTKNKIPIIALDVTAARLKKLEFNLERLGVQSVSWYRKDALYVQDIASEFQFILLDAPCSGNYCIEQDFFTKRSPRDFKDRARLQRKLLRASWAALAEGGTLVYSTCSLEPEEDEEIIQWALENLEGCKVKKISASFGSAANTSPFGTELDPGIAQARKLWPDTHETQGFFIAKLVKEE